MPNSKACSAGHTDTVVRNRALTGSLGATLRNTSAVNDVKSVSLVISKCLERRI
jgi:hypothetical protein